MYTFGADLLRPPAAEPARRLAHLLDRPVTYPSPQPEPTAGVASPSRGHLLTERRLAAAAAIDALSVPQMLGLMNTQDLEAPRAVRDALPGIAAVVEAAVEGMRRGGRLVYLGAGTSGRLGVLDASEAPPTFQAPPAGEPGSVVGIIAGGDVSLRKSSEGAEDDPHGPVDALDALTLGDADTVIGIAAGGTTPWVWGGLGHAKARGARVAMMCCVRIKSLQSRDRAKVVPPNQPLHTPATPTLPVQLDHVIELLVGPEIVTGSTRLKAGTATKLALNMISTAAMVQLGKTWGNLMVDLRASNAKLRDRALRILTEQLQVDRAVARDLLDEADGQVKVALVMHRLGLDAAEAQLRIDEHGGRLRPLLGAPRS
jgi:N-acetylmuramic acid 6-phosphate etherase